MASSAFSPVSRSRRNQVFVSFRGEDTRNNFTSHLVAALRRRAIDTYIDNKLEKGGEISPTLMEAIETSRISIVVLSKNYASSSWCLNELSRIIDCKQRNNQIIVPIFYHVDPSDVRNQRGTFAEAFVEHAKKRAGHEVETWKAALREVANLSGCHVKMERCESELIEEIVTDISTKLSCTSSSNFQDLVGIYSRIEQLKSQLHFEFKEVVTVGIWGMGGIGKTTIAEAVFHQISAQFEGCCFLTNVREESERHGLNFLRNKLISSILEDKNLDVGTMLLPPIIHDRLQFKKVLIILDDVNDSTQLEILPPRHCFGHGSRIIITSRDRQVLQQVFDPRYDQIYEVQGLTDGEALELFSLFAFKQSYPKEDYMGLSHKLVEYAKGVPLALKVLGSALKEKSSRVWESALHKLKETPNPKIDNVLRISYDELDDKEKDIFLDIACFFRGVHIDCVTEILEGFNFSAVAGIDVLIDKSLIARRNSMLEMHDLLHEMGQNIVRKSSKEPGKRSRLWKPEDIYNVLKNNTGTEAVEAMFLDMSTIRELHISPTAFARMQNLRMLKFYSTYPKDRKLHVTGSDLLSLSDRLSYLRWDGYPFKSLPLTFCAENLVYLYMPHSNVKKLWNRPQNLVNLKWLSLYGSKHLVEIPDLSRAINLKTVDLSHCSSLVDISSIQYAYKLSFLYLEYCKSLGHLPNCTGLTSLKFLNLHNCSKITNFPEISSSIEHLGLSGTGIQKVSSSVEGFRRLKHMDLCYCKRLQSLPSGLCKLEAFARLNLSSFSILESCRQILGSVERLEISGLDGITRGLMLSSTKPLRIDVLLTGTKSAEIGSLQNCMSKMKSLKWLSCSSCSKLGELPYNLPNLPSLQLVCLSDCKLLKFPSCLTNMLSLRSLDLSRNDFKTIPRSIKQLSSLTLLDLTDCRKLQSLPELPLCLQYLNADDCTSLAAVSTLLTMSLCGKRMTFSNCRQLDPNAIENEARRTILHKAKEDVRIYSKGRGNGSPLIICYPGSEVPKWFTFQDTGSSITIKLPPHFHDNRCLGIAVVTILSHYHHTKLGLKVSCSFKTKYGDSHQFFVSLAAWHEDEFRGQPPRYLGSDDVLIGYTYSFYDNVLEFGEGHFNEASFEISIPFAGRPSSIIKKCGVCLLYGQDAEESYQNMACNNDAEPSRNSKFDEEKEPHPKRFKYSQLC